jgi:hypothetical protein
LITCLLAIAALAAAGAAPLNVETLPGRAVVATPCGGAPTDACWEHATALHRFAAAPGQVVAPLEADIRLGWDPTGLTVRVGPLPDGGHIELGIAPTGDDARLTALEVIEATQGVHHLRLAAAPVAGTTHALRLNLVVPTGDGGTTALAWTPAGSADLARAGVVLLADAPSPGIPLTVSTTGSDLSVLAPGASRVQLRAQPVLPPRGSRGVPKPWLSEGEDRVAAAHPPDPGWLMAEAIWTTADGAAIDIVRRRFWWAGPPAPGALALGIHPEPKSLRAASGPMWRPRTSQTVCVSDPAWAEAAVLLVEELARHTGETLQIVDPDHGRCDVRFVPLAGESKRPVPETNHSDAFSLHVRGRSVRVGANSLRGAVTGALALADAVGPDGGSPSLTAFDWPDVDERVLYHSINVRARPDWTVDDQIRFLRRVVARGRYTTLYLAIRDGVVLPSHPELATRDAISVAEFQRIIAAGRALGMTVAPAVDGPGHPLWIARVHPELGTNARRPVLDLRSGATRRLLTEIYDDLLVIFGDVDRIHLGHDEVMWRTTGGFSDEANPHMAGTPRWLLFRDSLRFHLEWAASHDLAPLVWSDTLLAKWNGSREGGFRALELLTDEERARLTIVAWAAIGDPLETLSPSGVAVMRVHTGYLDWKRAGLNEQQARLAGEGLAVFVPAPWAAQGPTAGTRNRHYHTGSVILAGTTAWRSDLDAVSIGATLDALRTAPAFRPGLDARCCGAGPRTTLAIQGDQYDRSLPAVVWPAALAVGEDTVQLSPHVARLGRPVTIPVTDEPAGVALLMATVIEHRAGLRLLSGLKGGGHLERRVVATIDLHRADGTVTSVPLTYGIDIYALEAEAWAAPQWHAAATASLSSPAAATTRPDAADRLLTRRDIPVGAGAPVTKVEIRTEHPGVAIVVAAAQAQAP